MSINKGREKVTILLLHASYQAVSGSILKLLRNSSNYDFTIIGCDSMSVGYCSASLLVDKYYQITKGAEDKYIEQIQTIVYENNVDFIYSAEESDLKLLKTQNLPSLKESIPEEKIFDLFLDKYVANLDVESKGFKVPKIYYSKQEILSDDPELLIVREKVSCCSRGITVYNKLELLEQLNSDTADLFNTQAFPQKFAKGTGYNIDVFCDKDGNVLLAIPRNCLSAKDGTTFQCEVLHKQELIDYALNFYSQYCIPGISNLQCKLDEHGDIWFIELNVRCPATLIASALASHNFIDLLVDHYYKDQDLPCFVELMSTVKWNSIISRYYEETITSIGTEICE